MRLDYDAACQPGMPDVRIARLPLGSSAEITHPMTCTYCLRVGNTDKTNGVVMTNIRHRRQPLGYLETRCLAHQDRRQ